MVLRQNVSTARECLGLRAYLNYQIWAISNQRAKDSVPQYGIYYLTSPFQVRSSSRSLPLLLLDLTFFALTPYRAA